MTTAFRSTPEEAYGTDAGNPAKAATRGGAGQRLSAAEVADFVTRALDGADLDAKSVCLVVPDATRTCPLPLLLTAARDALAGRPARSRW